MRVHFCTSMQYVIFYLLNEINTIDNDLTMRDWTYRWKSGIELQSNLEEKNIRNGSKVICSIDSDWTELFSVHMKNVN